MLNGSVFTIAEENSETFASLCSQLRNLLKAGNSDFENLCASKRINIWSPFKPIRSNEPFNISYEDRKAANFGLGWPVKSSPSEVKAIYDSSNELNGWEHLAPRGLAYGEYNRIRDFNNYNHAASSPFAAFSYPGTAINKAGGSFNAQTIIQGVTGSGNNSTISIAEMASLKNRFFAIQLKQKNGAIVKTRTAEKTIGESGVNISIPTADMPIGEYDVIPFIAPMSLEYNVALPGMECIPIPYNKVGIFTIIDSYYIIGFEAWKVGNNVIEYRYTIKNTSAASKNFNNNYIYFRLRSKDFSDILLSYETQQLLLPITVAAGSAYDSGWLSKEVSSQVYSDPRLWISLDNASEVTYVVPLAQAGDKV